MDQNSQIQANQKAWGVIAREHYEHFREKMADPAFVLNPLVDEELGDIAGKRILHLQCNTGADSILLARKGARVPGVDLVPENIGFARKLAQEFAVDVEFIQSDVLKLDQVHVGQYDIVLTTDGVLGWLPDLEQWGRVIGKFLQPDGFFYLHDAHPFFLIFDEDGLKEGKLVPRYPYYQAEADEEMEICGYASPTRETVNYYWNHKLSDIINGLLAGNLVVTWMKEHPRCVVGMGGSVADDQELMFYPELKDFIPLTLSVKAKYCKL